MAPITHSLAQARGVKKMGIHPKIGITGLPKSGKSAVMEKVVDMITNERKNERENREMIVLRVCRLLEE